jgi:hypothetical protein
MPSFKDLQQREWNVDLTVAGLERVAKQTDFDLLNLLDDQLKGLAELYDKPIKLVQILYAICEPQIDAAGLEPEEFGELFAGSVLQAAADAVVEATAAFFQSPKQGEILRAMVQKVKTGADYHLVSVAAQLDVLSDDEIRRSVDRSLKRKTQPSDEQTAGLSNSATEQQELPA